MTIDKEEYKIIQKSGMFCHDWFKINYNLDDGIDLIEYYLIHSRKLGLNPSPHFDTKWYLENYLDVKNSDMNPFVHYIKYGIKENRYPYNSDKSKFSLHNTYYNTSFLKKYDDFVNDVYNNRLNGKVNIALFLKSTDGNFLPTSYIRLLIPLYHIFMEKNINPYVFYGSDFKRLKGDVLLFDEKLFDVIIVQRDCLDFTMTKFLCEYKDIHGTKLIYEIDDDLLSIDENHPNYSEFIPKKKVIEYLLSNANCVTVSTNVLKQKLSDFNKNIVVMRNCLNDLLNKPILDYKNNNIVKIGYMGSFTHKNDIKIIEKAVSNVQNYFLDKYGKKVIFEIIGVTNEIPNFAKSIEIPNDCKSYPKFINWIWEVIDWDIALAPLENNDINSSKSEIKFLEYSAMGIPGIFSNIGAYSEVIQDGNMGLLVNNSTKEWESALIKLIEDEKLYKDIVTNSRRLLDSNYSVNNMIDNWINLFNELLDFDKNKLFNNPNSRLLLSNPRFKEDYNIILNSSLFDKDFYFDHYPDVKLNNIDPIYHYISLGSVEGCNPFESFNTLEYAKENNLNLNEINPLVHYIKNISNNHHKWIEINDTENIFSNMSNKVSIIVPIYNAYDDTKHCVESILKNSTKEYELILINDCSTDNRIVKLLENYKKYPTIKVIHNSLNKGFVGTVNVGLKNSEYDVILLNSDTIVTPKWLEKLTIAAYSNKIIGTVTPFSNNAGAFSVPDIGIENKIPNDLNLNSVANIVEKVSNHEYMYVPTGNGFCMYIKRDVIDTVGLLDEKTFGRGYGEENDFCMRAIEKGWINVIDDSTYILHNKGSSFSSEREKLIAEHRKLLDEKHPTYTEKVREFVNSNKLKIMQDKIRFGLNNYSIKKYDKKRILFVIHSKSGGTPKTNEDLMKQVEKYADCYLLFAHTNIMILYHFINGKLVKISEWSFDSRWWAEKFYDKKYEQIYFNILFNLQIDLVHIRHLIHHTFDLPIVAKKMGIPVVMSFHDFYMVCPSFTLLDENYNYCEGICNDNLINCKLPSEGISQEPIIKNFIKKWRTEVSKIFKYVDYFVTTSEVVKQVFVKIYPNSFDNNFVVIEHGRDFEEVSENLFEVPSKNKPIKILFTGNILRHKGSEIIKEIHDLDSDNNIEFHFLGSTDKLLENFGVHHGKYERETLISHISDIKPSFIGIFSIWPETFCHTLTEAWSCHIPVLATNIGVIRDRVLKNEGGVFIDMDNPLKSYDLILDIKNNPEHYVEIQKKIEKINFKSEEEMGDDYIKIYKKLM